MLMEANDSETVSAAPEPVGQATIRVNRSATPYGHRRRGRGRRRRRPGRCASRGGSGPTPSAGHPGSPGCRRCEPPRPTAAARGPASRRLRQGGEPVGVGEGPGVRSIDSPFRGVPLEPDGDRRGHHGDHQGAGEPDGEASGPAACACLVVGSGLSVSGVVLAAWAASRNACSVAVSRGALRPRQSRAWANRTPR